MSKDWRTSLAMRDAKQAMRDGVQVMNHLGERGKIVKADFDNKEFTFLVRYGKHSLGWVRYDRIRMLEPAEPSNELR